MDDFLTPGKIDPKLRHAYDDVSSSTGFKDQLEINTLDKQPETKATSNELSDQILKKQAELKNAYEKPTDTNEQDKTASYNPKPEDYVKTNQEKIEQPSYLINSTTHNHNLRNLAIIFAIILFFTFYTLSWGKVLGLF